MALRGAAIGLRTASEESIPRGQVGALRAPIRSNAPGSTRRIRLARGLFGHACVTSRLLSPLRVWLLFAALFVPLVFAGAPVEAQRSGAAAARRVRAARARARRVRAAQRQARLRAMRGRRGRLQAARARRAAARNRRPADDDHVDIDFAMEAIENETPPPPVDDIAEVEARQMAARRQNLDPELYGGATDEERPPVLASEPAEVGEHSPLRVRALVRAFERGLTLQGVERGAITDYELPIGPAAGFGLEYYPGAHVTNSALAHLGLMVDFHHSFAVESQGPNDVAYPTTEYAWLAGLRFRLPLGGRSEIGLEVAGGQQAFRVERGGLDNEAPVGVPYVEHSFLRAGGSFRIDAGDVVLGGRVAYLPTFDMGALGRELGGGFGHGVEAGFTFLYPLDLGFALLAEAEARVFILDFDSPGTSRSAAAGAIDRYVGVNVGVEWDFPAATQL